MWKLTIFEIQILNWWTFHSNDSWLWSFKTFENWLILSQEMWWIWFPSKKRNEYHFHLFTGCICKLPRKSITHFQSLSSFEKKSITYCFCFQQNISISVNYISHIFCAWKECILNFVFFISKWIVNSFWVLFSHFNILSKTEFEMKNFWHSCKLSYTLCVCHSHGYYVVVNTWFKPRVAHFWLWLLF